MNPTDTTSHSSPRDTARRLGFMAVAIFCLTELYRVETHLGPLAILAVIIVTVAACLTVVRGRTDPATLACEQARCAALRQQLDDTQATLDEIVADAAERILDEA